MQTSQYARCIGRVLMISAYFYPDNNIGAIRPTKISKELYRAGYAVDVLTRYCVEEDDAGERIFTHLFGLEKRSGVSIRTQTSKQHGSVYSLLYKYYHMTKDILNAWKMRRMFKLLLNEDERLRNTQYDAVVSSFGPLSSLLCGMCYKKLHPTTKWISDFRDPVVVDFIPFPLKLLFRWYQHRANKMADVITGVSIDCLKSLHIAPNLLVNESSYVLPNGFDRDDIIGVPRALPTQGKLVFTYCGILYSGLRDFTALFRSVRALIDRGDLDKSKLLFRYAGHEGSIFLSSADVFSLRDCVEDCGYVKRQQSLEMQMKSDILLLASWNSKKMQGCVTGKVYEYMMMNKPIVAVIVGDLPDSATKKMINDMHLGCCYEDASKEIDATILEEYILMQYRRKMAGGPLIHEPVQELLDRFDYRNIAKEFIGIIDGIAPQAYGI